MPTNPAPLSAEDVVMSFGGTGPLPIAIDVDLSPTPVRTFANPLSDTVQGGVKYVIGTV
jgi:hypothetical protein